MILRFILNADAFKLERDHAEICSQFLVILDNETDVDTPKNRNLRHNFQEDIKKINLLIFLSTIICQ